MASDGVDWHDIDAGDGAVIDAVGPRNITNHGIIRGVSKAGTLVTSITRQGGLGLPSYNPKPDLPEIKELTGQDDRILSALGFREDSIE
jgi:hypothetical protein